MHLKSLELHGFKSFADRTSFEFHEGVTAIVGPNGCGKSNVVDAVRWVLGETSAKALRGGEMADVIFSGTDKRKPTGMAEVTLNLAGCEDALKTEFSEVAITRRVFRDGKSEYRINGTLCRLRDIHDLFLDTGIGRSAYSIMEQGKIDMLLSARPEDRRQVFEEAAGISKFKKEKREALRKLEYTEANLLRVNDVLEEQERRINSLKRQVAKARRYKAFAQDLKVLDTHLSHRRFVECEAEREELRTSLRALESRRRDLDAALPEREKAAVEARDRAQNLEGELSELRQRRSHHQNAAHAAQSRIHFNEERCAELQERIASNRNDLGEVEEKLAQQEFDFNQSREELDALLERISAREQVAERKGREVESLAKKRHETARHLHEAREESRRCEAALASCEARIESVEESSRSSRGRLRHLVDEEEVLRIELAELQTTEQELARGITEARQQTARIEDQQQGAERQFQHARGDLDAARARRLELDRDLTARQSRLDLLKQLLERGEGLREGTQSVLAGLDDPDLIQPGLQGVLGNRLRVRPGFEQAVDDRLTESAQGEASLIALEWIGGPGGRQMQTTPDGAECWVADCVEVDEMVAPVVMQLLENVLVVSDRETAFRLREQDGRWSFVTTSGEVLHPEGIMRGGRPGGGAEDSLLQRQNEVAGLEEESARLRGLLEAAAREEAAAGSRAEELQALSEQSRDRLQRQRVDLSTLEGQHTLAEREVKAFESKLANVGREQQLLREGEEETNRVRNALENELQEARRQTETLEGEIRRLAEETEELGRREAGEREEFGNLQTALAVERRAREAAEQQQEPIRSRIDELRELNARRMTEIEDFERRIATARSEDESLRAEVKQHQEKASELEARLEETGGRRGELRQAIAAAEDALTGIRHRIDELGEQRGREEVALAKVEMRTEKLVETAMERYQTDLGAFEPDTHVLLATMNEQRKTMRAIERRRATLAARAAEEEDGEPAGAGEDDAAPPAATATAGRELEDMELEDGPDWEFIENAVTELRRKIDSMGPVNVDSIEEYEELEERHRFVRGQHDDLVSSKEELLGVIARINEETTKLFAETFEQVRTNFREMFRELFTSNGKEGKADLILLDDEDPLESGIEVIAKPPGKKLQSISLLSGGERSMTAVALLFSIYMVKPSPFCILDELDAPLDEANIGRFLRVLDRFIEQSQFIIVTHNKRTMNRADVLYGVTMEEFGVSKLVGMRLTGAEGTAGEARTAAAKAAASLGS